MVSPLPSVFSPPKTTTRPFATAAAAPLVAVCRRVMRLQFLVFGL